MKTIMLVLFILFLLSYASAVCNAGDICTVEVHLGRLESYDVENIKKFDFVITNTSGLGMDVPTPNIINVVDSSVPVVVYQSFIGRVEFYSTNCINPWIEVNQHNDWFWLDNGGNRIFDTDYPSSFEMEVTNTAYQDYTAQHSADILSCVSGLDGFFNDNTSTFYSWELYTLPDASCQPNCPPRTEAEFEGGVISILQKMKSSIGSAIQVINAAHYPDYLEYVDGQMIEEFIHSDDQQGANQYYTEATMLTQINFLGNSLLANKRVFIFSGNAVPSSQMLNFTFAAYLIGKRNDAFTYFYYNDASTPAYAEYFPELYDLQLGLASGDYFTQSTVLVRNFENGKVLLNLKNSASPTIDLGGTFTTLQGSTVTSVSLGAYTGLILLNSSPPQNCDADNDGFNALSCGGNDCNDNSAGIHPGASEICGNGIDEDCSGGDTSCIATCGNGNIDSGETCSNCAQDFGCSSSTVCCNAACVIPTCTNNSQCNDSNPLTTDSCINPGQCNASCSHIVPQNPLCGNSRIDAGENCSSCPSDVSCVAGRVCSNASCVLPLCSSNADCNDNDSCTSDVCVSASIGCSYTIAPACDETAMRLVVPLQAAEGETFVVTVVGKDNKPILGANIVYGKQVAFSDLFGRAELTAEKDVLELSASKIGYPVSKARIIVTEAQQTNLEKFIDFGELGNAFINPIFGLLIVGVFVAASFFFILIHYFKKGFKSDFD